MSKDISLRETIELELWRFRSIKDHDEALRAVPFYIDAILREVKSHE